MNTETTTQPVMTRDDVMRETFSHVRRVGHLMLDVVENLQRRSMRHDDSKFSPEEFPAFAKSTPKLRALTYDSPEYKVALDDLGPALDHHYAHNRHHPQYFESGVQGMDLLDLIEMLADWKAATERHHNGSIERSIVGNIKRFKYSREMAILLAKTAANLGWLNYEEFEQLLYPSMDGEVQLTGGVLTKV